MRPDMERFTGHIEDFRALQRRRSTRDYRGHFPLSFQSGKYSVRVAENWDQVVETLRLRHAVYTREYQVEPSPFQLDLDSLDLECDHLMVIDTLHEQVVGTYRLLSSETCWSFYHQNEFLNSDAVLTGKRFLELGRACVAPEHRNGLVLRLLWRAILMYARCCRAEVLIGCSSVNIQDRAEILEICHYFLNRGELIVDTPILPTPRYRLPDLNLASLRGRECRPRDEVLAKISPLLRSYLSAGALIHGEPAYDREFQCIDFFTRLELSSLHSRYAHTAMATA